MKGQDLSYLRLSFFLLRCVSFCLPVLATTQGFMAFCLRRADKCVQLMLFHATMQGFGAFCLRRDAISANCMNIWHDACFLPLCLRRDARCRHLAFFHAATQGFMAFCLRRAYKCVQLMCFLVATQGFERIYLRRGMRHLDICSVET